MDFINISFVPDVKYRNDLFSTYIYPFTQFRIVQVWCDSIRIFNSIYCIIHLNISLDDKLNVKFHSSTFITRICIV